MEKQHRELTSRYLTEEDKKDICAWHYDGAYAIYDLPPYEEMRERKMGFMNPEKERNFRAFLDGDTLAGFVNILEEPTEVFIGIGAAPDLCGKHYGRQILDEAFRISKTLYPDKPLYLEVRCWNERAIKCYQKAGFFVVGAPFEQITGIGNGTFYRMVKE